MLAPPRSRRNFEYSRQSHVVARVVSLFLQRMFSLAALELTGFVPMGDSGSELHSPHILHKHPLYEVGAEDKDAYTVQSIVTLAIHCCLWR